MTHEVELPDDDSSVSTELQCDIQPGALRQRYSVQWIQFFNTFHINIAGGMFNLTLIVTIGSQYLQMVHYISAMSLSIIMMLMD